MHERCDKVRAAGACAQLDRRAVYKAVYRARHDRREQRAPAVVGVINEAAQVYLCLKQKQRARKHKRECKRLQREIPVHEYERKYRQRDIDYKRHIAHAEMKQVLHHGCDTVYARRCERVLQYEYLVVKRHRHCQSHNRGVFPHAPHMRICHHAHPPLNTVAHYSTIFAGCKFIFAFFDCYPSLFSTVYCIVRLRQLLARPY